MSAPITLTGRLGADPVIHFSPNGTGVAGFSMVTNGRRMVEGTWEDTDTTWWKVTCFGKTAEAVVEAARKGDLVTVIGKAKQTEWEKDGVKHKQIEVVADQIGLVLPIKPRDNAAAGGFGAGEAAF